MKPDPLTYAPANPHAAPMIIMPSRPRLSTPARSAISSPAAASSSGVDAASTDRMTASSSPIDGSGAASKRRIKTRIMNADAVEDQGVAGQHVEQQDTLEHLGEV